MISKCIIKHDVEYYVYSDAICTAVGMKDD